MKEYRVQGLSCSFCASRIEEEIKGLKHGEDARLSYNTGMLRMNEAVSLDDVKRILKSDGAYLAPQQQTSSSNGLTLPQRNGEAQQGESQGHSNDHGHSYDQNHDHSDNHNQGHNHAQGHRGPLLKVTVSAALYAAALLFDWALDAQSSGGEWIVIALLAVAMVLSGYTTFWRGLRYLVRFKFTMDTLMTVALIGAVAIGEWKEAALVAILFGVNEWLEGIGMERARRSMESLLQVAPKEAVRLNNGAEEVIPIEALREGDLVRIKPGGKIPSDGIVTEGRSSVNEAAITGESMPVEKHAGEPVFGGSLNNEGLLDIRITKAYADSSLAKILHLVREAQETKTPTELFIQRFAKYYTPAIMIIAALVMLVPPLLLQGDWLKWLYQGLAVLIVGCPCALILASPVAIVSGISRLARHGILVKGGVHLEQLGKVDTLAFDKTGTLTIGKPYVVKLAAFDEARFLPIAGAIEQASSHPLALAVMRVIVQQGIRTPKPDWIRNMPGQGVEAFIDGQRYRLGNEASASQTEWPQEARQLVNEWKEAGLTIVLVTDTAQVLGMFGIEDEVREESREVVAKLHALGIRRTVMLTGDHARTAAKVAASVGITSYESSLLPEDKVGRVKALAADSKVAMIGDGVNDAPALAAASLGIAMGKGTDSAIETADIVLMQDHLGKLPEAVKTAKRVNHLIRFNIAVALGLKAIALLLTIPGLLTLWIAILSDMGATIFVTLTGMTLLLERKDRRTL